MKKVFFIFLAGAVAAACSQIEIASDPSADMPKGDVFFVGDIESTKVLTDQGVSAWQLGDEISVFSVADGADAGVSVSANLIYKADAAGASAEFSAKDGALTPSDKYYAYFPKSPTYPSNLNAASSVGFTAKTSGDPVTDYRYLPVTVNTGEDFLVDPATGLSTLTNASKFFYAQGVAPASSLDPVALHFQPVLPILEFGLTGIGTVKSVKVAYKDKATDTRDNATNRWLTGKGIFDASTGTLTTTNTSSTAYCWVQANLKESTEKAYVDLDLTRPVRFQLTVGRFKVTKGLTLTITDKDGGVITKDIWADKTVTGVNESTGTCRHIYQPVVVPYLTSTALSGEFPVEGGNEAITVTSSSNWTATCPDWVTLSASSGAPGANVTVTVAASTSDARSGNIVFTGADGATCSVPVSQAAYVAVAANWYSVALADLDWSASYVHYVKDAGGNLIGMIAKEFFGATVGKQGIVAYPMASATKADYTKGKVAQVTLDGSVAPTGNVHGGSVSFTSMLPGDVVYTEGSSAAAATVWFKEDGSSVLLTDPGTSSTGVLLPLVVTSDVKSHPVVKLGTQIWTATEYQTTKDGSGNAFTQFTVNSTFWTSGDKGYYIHEGSYIYSGYALGFSTDTPAVYSEGFAPAGWKVPTRDNVKTDLFGFLGNAWADMQEGGRSLLNAPASTFIFKTKAPTTLAYFAIRTSTPGTAGNSYMVGYNGPGKKVVDSAQTLMNGLPTRLIME